MSELTVPEIPVRPTPEEATRLHLELARLQVIVSNTSNAFAEIAEVTAQGRHDASMSAAQERHDAAMAAAEARHAATQAPLTLLDFAAALAARAPLDATVEQLDAVTRARWGWLQRLMAEPQPPLTLNDAQAEFYLRQYRDEFLAAGAPMTVEWAQGHWVAAGRAEGREWLHVAPA